MIKKLVTITALAMLLGPPVSQADRETTGEYTDGFTSGYDLAEYCKGKHGYVDEGLCIGYVTAVFDSMIQKPEKKNDKICPPSHTLQLNLKLIVNKYLKENPGSLPFNADDSASIAIWMAFPCPDRDP